MVSDILSLKAKLKTQYRAAQKYWEAWDWIETKNEVNGMMVTLARLMEAVEKNIPDTQEDGQPRDKEGLEKFQDPMEKRMNRLAASQKV